jgi:hypothetical protein
LKFLSALNCNYLEKQASSAANPFCDRRAGDPAETKAAMAESRAMLAQRKARFANADAHGAEVENYRHQPNLLLKK